LFESFSEEISNIWKSILLSDWIIFLHDIVDVFETGFEEGFMFLDLLSLSRRIRHSIAMCGSWGHFVSSARKFCLVKCGLRSKVLRALGEFLVLVKIEIVYLYFVVLSPSKVVEFSFALTFLTNLGSANPRPQVWLQKLREVARRIAR
jgi:hypothetical protein